MKSRSRALRADADMSSRLDERNRRNNKARTNVCWKKAEPASEMQQRIRLVRLLIIPAQGGHRSSTAVGAEPTPPRPIRRVKIDATPRQSGTDSSGSV
ncbi:hypothetical protein Aduo_009614 [Ancylostoma duodenale]